MESTKRERKEGASKRKLEKKDGEGENETGVCSTRGGSRNFLTFLPGKCNFGTHSKG